jgi:hypothetical protein
MPARTGARLHEPSIFDALPPGDNLDDFTA